MVADAPSATGRAQPDGLGAVIPFLKGRQRVEQMTMTTQESGPNSTCRMPRIMLRAHQGAKPRLQFGVVWIFDEFSFEPIDHFHAKFGDFLRRIVNMPQASFGELRGKVVFG